MSSPDSGYDEEAAIAAAVASGHHKEIVGGLWEAVGSLQFEFLKRHGLATSDHLLDIGCGSLRGGVHFVAYLQPGHYWGVDSNEPLLEAGYQTELTKLNLTDRLPRTNLLHEKDFNFDRFNRTFDIAIAQSVFTHLSGNRIRLCLYRLAKAMRPGARLFATFFEVPEHHPVDDVYVHPTGGVRSFAYKDPFHYRMSEIEAFVADLPWRIKWSGDWDHPRDQKMVIFERLPDAQPAETVTNKPDQLSSPKETLTQRPGAGHYRAYVGPPDRFDFMAASQFALLFALGIREHHTVLDFGCGSLRLGRLLIPYLAPGNYFGIDPNRWLIEEGIAHELGWSAVRLKRPVFAYNDDFRCDVFGRRFDFIVAQSILTHCGRSLARHLLSQIAAALEPTGIAVFSIKEAKKRKGESLEEGWAYPRNVPYLSETVLEFCTEAGLTAKRLPWYHPGAVWYIAARDPDRLPTPQDMTVLSGSVLFDPQFAAGRPSRTSATMATHATVDTSPPKKSDCDLGTVSFLTNGRIEVNSFARFQFRYTIGTVGLASGARLRITCRHMTGISWSSPQTTDPTKPGFLTARTGSDTPVQIRGWAATDDFLELFPWQFSIQITVGAPLAPGDFIEVVFGETSGGGPGTKVQLFAEPVCRFRLFVEPKADGVFHRIGSDISFPIDAGPPAKLVVIVTPARPRASEPVRTTIRAEDRFGNVANSYRGNISLTWLNGPDQATKSVELDEGASGVACVDDIAFSYPGYVLVKASDGNFIAESNPVHIDALDSSSVGVFWGEIHGHTLFSDGRGTLEQYYDYAERVCGLDVCTVTDHDFMISDSMWENSKRITNQRNRAGRFVTLNAYEWTGPTDVGGDHNVYFADDDPPILRSHPYDDPRNTRIYHGDSARADHIEELFDALTRLSTKGRVLTAPHFGGRPANPKWIHSELDRLVEIYSEHQRSERWATEFLSSRLGIAAGGDDHIGRPGNGFLRFIEKVQPSPYGQGLIAIEAPALNREAIFRALYDRRVYATTGARILLRVSVSGAPMGSEVKLDSAPTVSVEVAGTAPVVVVQILKDWAVVHEEVPHPSGAFDEQQYLAAYKQLAERFGDKPGRAFEHYCRAGFRNGRKRFMKGPAGENSTRMVTFAWTDPRFNSFKSGAYAIRVLQEDGSIAISSPVWVN